MLALELSPPALLAADEKEQKGYEKGARSVGLDKKARDETTNSQLELVRNVLAKPIGRIPRLAKLVGSPV